MTVAEGGRRGPGLIAERLRLALDLRGITAVPLAEKAGIAKSTLYTWLAGDTDQSAEGIAALAGVLKVSADYLLGLDPQPLPEVPSTPEEWLPYEFIHVCGSVGAGAGHSWAHEPGEECRASDLGERLPVKRRDLERCRDFGQPRVLRVTDARSAGRSMLPVIGPGSLLLAAVGDRIPLVPGRAYIVRDPLDGGLMCKEVYTWAGGLVFVSRNPDFPRVLLPMDPDTDAASRGRPVVGIVMRILDQDAARADEEIIS